MIQTQRGFTLLELMVAVAILAILAAIAVPSYSHFIKKAQLRDAQAALMDNAQALERYYAGHHKFTKNVAELKDFKSTTKHFDISFSDKDACAGATNDDNHYCMLAVSKNTKNESRVLVLTETGQLLLCESNATDKCAVY